MEADGKKDPVVVFPPAWLLKCEPKCLLCFIFNRTFFLYLFIFFCCTKYLVSDWRPEEERWRKWPTETQLRCVPVLHARFVCSSHWRGLRIPFFSASFGGLHQKMSICWIKHLILKLFFFFSFCEFKNQDTDTLHTLEAIMFLCLIHEKKIQKIYLPITLAIMCPSHQFLF